MVAETMYLLCLLISPCFPVEIDHFPLFPKTPGRPQYGYRFISVLVLISSRRTDKVQGQ